MAKYINTAPHAIKIRGTHGIITIESGDIVELESAIAHRGRPFLVEYQEQGKQLLIEAPEALIVADETVDLAEQVEEAEEAEEADSVEGDGE